MLSRKDRLHAGAQWLRRHWVALSLVAVTAVMVMAGQPLMAADAQPSFNQTVPPPTPRPGVPDPGDDDDNQEDNSSVAETAAEQQQPAVTPAAPGAGAQTAVVNALTLNVRGGPGTTFPVIGKLAQGAVVTVEARNAAGDWWLVCCVAGTETRGWVSAEFVTAEFDDVQAAALPVSDSTVTAVVTTTAAVTTTTAATPVPGSLPGSVAGVNLNVRSGPTTTDPVIAKLRADDVVSVLGRNAAGDWLYICCVGAPAGNGWVSAAFITPTFTVDDLEQVSDTAQTATSPAAAAPAATAGTTTGPVDTTAASGETAGAALSVAIAQQPPFAVQGKEVAFVYTVRNNGATALTDVVLSSELPGPFTLMGVAAGTGTVTQDQAPAVEITWPELAAGESATATLRVRVADDVPNGATFANLATVTAGDQSASTGITIGMPPSLLPEFW